MLYIDNLSKDAKSEKELIEYARQLMITRDFGGIVYDDDQKQLDAINSAKAAIEYLQEQGEDWKPLNESQLKGVLYHRLEIDSWNVFNDMLVDNGMHTETNHDFFPQSKEVAFADRNIDKLLDAYGETDGSVGAETFVKSYIQQHGATMLTGVMSFDDYFDKIVERAIDLLHEQGIDALTAQRYCINHKKETQEVADMPAKAESIAEMIREDEI